MFYHVSIIIRRYLKSINETTISMYGSNKIGMYSKKYIISGNVIFEQQILNR